ncbi:MAG: glycosyltransferase [Prevotella sp.]|nr:glycosyltransferase [Prevotella sp.]
MFLTFIIPLYNAGRFVSVALDSIFENPLDEGIYEVVVIDDGSIDNGVEIVKVYAEKHKNLRLLQQANQGASAARNRGIEAAKGEYIWFVDADDRIEPTILATVWQIYQERPHTELYGFNHTDCCGDDESPRVTYRKQLSTDGLGLLRSHPYMYLWNRIFRRSAIGDIRFPEGTRNTEDWYFDLMVFVRLKHVECIPMSGYYYNSSNPYSTLRNRSRESLKKNAEDSQLMHRLIWEEIQRTDNPGIKSELQRSLNYSVMGFFYGMFVDHFPVKDIYMAMRNYKPMGLYPIPKSGSKRGNKFLRLANRPYLLYPVVIVRNLFSPIYALFKKVRTNNK